MTSATTFDRILVVVSHTDDLECNAGGSVRHWINAGAEVALVVLADGRNGTPDPDADPQAVIDERQAEQIRAAGHLGIKPDHIIFAGLIDGAISNTPETREPIVRAIRWFKPTAVVTWDPMLVYDLQTGIPNHRDHRETGLAVIDAVYPDARNPKTFPEHFEEDLGVWTVNHIFMMSGDGRPNYFVPLSESELGTKRAAISEHGSQSTPGLLKLAADRERLQAASHHPEAAAVEAFVYLEIPTGI